MLLVSCYPLCSMLCYTTRSFYPRSGQSGELTEAEAEAQAEAEEGQGAALSLSDCSDGRNAKSRTGTAPLSTLPPLSHPLLRSQGSAPVSSSATTTRRRERGANDVCPPRSTRQRKSHAALSMREGSLLQPHQQRGLRRPADALCKGQHRTLPHQRGSSLYLPPQGWLSQWSTANPAPHCVDMQPAAPRSSLHAALMHLVCTVQRTVTARL